MRDAKGGAYVDMHTGLIMWASPPSSVGQVSPPGSVSGRGAGARARERERAGLNGERGKAAAGGRTNGYAGAKTARIDSTELEEATAVIMQFKSVLDDAGFATLQKCECFSPCLSLTRKRDTEQSSTDVRRYDAQIMPLEGSSGLLVRVQRLLDMSAPRIDDRRKRDLMQQFTRVVSQTS